MTYSLFSPFDDSTDSFLTPFLNDAPENNSQMIDPIDPSRPMTYVSPFRPPASTTPRSFESLPRLTVNPAFKLNRSLSAKLSSINLVSPSIFYTFPENSTLSLHFDVVTNDSAVSFVTQPPLSITEPRFLIYAVVQAGISPMPFKMILNGNTIMRRLNDITAVDVTNVLAPFGQKNWLVIETEGIVVPFSLIGVWAQFNTVEQIINTISARPSFPFTDITALCPITGHQIEIPAKGCHCNHEIASIYFPI
ncbi:hypothetical protein TVAG_015280 [Trichomonas vaginalis G3]|uniref:MIZ zinc finger family protein n=1 Tax=Trichomonas vaginalis (strain ATCC PRA-98 / G3) TaxID=412133 RepID=A2G649_TRIV3|nr:SUMO transferase protein [Trichomonas vaginalis G3]EAX87365.1 hypothetical protein TVAG_015280 [Trichomonas vaginalis G3]KAI5537403.1 SUMO transferase protein [Trichomonas vaginalis G3]|eukprot:XP_001300295.1 hypothetical protein [Trichomonas vaginalis G3]